MAAAGGLTSKPVAIVTGANTGIGFYTAGQRAGNMVPIESHRWKHGTSWNHVFKWRDLDPQISANLFWVTHWWRVDLLSPYHQDTLPRKKNGTQRKNMTTLFPAKIKPPKTHTTSKKNPNTTDSANHLPQQKPLPPRNGPTWLPPEELSGRGFHVILACRSLDRAANAFEAAQRRGSAELKRLGPVGAVGYYGSLWIILVYYGSVWFYCFSWKVYSVIYIYIYNMILYYIMLFYFILFYYIYVNDWFWFHFFGATYYRRFFFYFLLKYQCKALEKCFFSCKEMYTFYSYRVLEFTLSEVLGMLSLDSFRFHFLLRHS